ncbi:hypothetical protein MMC25_004628 [Agyrium rufum]|nr:hypothetical protein [Agyrium rufum]
MSDSESNNSRDPRESRLSKTSSAPSEPVFGYRPFDQRQLVNSAKGIMLSKIPDFSSMDDMSSSPVIEAAMTGSSGMADGGSTEISETEAAYSADAGSYFVLPLTSCCSSLLLLTSRPTLFRIGSKQEEFTMLAGIFAQLSTPLHKLLNGGMLEGRTHVMSFPEINTETFERLCEYAVKFDHSMSDLEKDLPHAIKPASSKTQSITGIENDDMDDCPVKNDPDPTPDLILWQERPFCGYGEWESFEHFHRAFGIFSSTPMEGVRSIILTNARLYCFAKQWLISRLEEAAFVKIGFLLAMSSYVLKSGQNYTALITYVYENTPAFEFGKPERLRDLLASFAASQTHGGTNCPPDEDMNWSDFMELDTEFLNDWLSYTRKVVRSFHKA